jgi:hypothetical protein
MNYLYKALTWILTSAVALVIGTVALVVNKSALAGTSNNGWQWPPHWPPHHDPPPVVPEVNSALVLLPIVFVVLLYCTRQLWRRRSEGSR